MSHITRRPVNGDDMVPSTPPLPPVDLRTYGPDTPPLSPYLHPMPMESEELTSWDNPEPSTAYISRQTATHNYPQVPHSDDDSTSNDGTLIPISPQPRPITPPLFERNPPWVVTRSPVRSKPKSPPLFERHPPWTVSRPSPSSVQVWPPYSYIQRLQFEVEQLRRDKNELSHRFIDAYSKAELYRTQYENLRHDAEQDARTIKISPDSWRLIRKAQGALAFRNGELLDARRQLSTQLRNLTKRSYATEDEAGNCFEELKLFWERLKRAEQQRDEFKRENGELTEAMGKLRDERGEIKDELANTKEDRDKLQDRVDELVRERTKYKKSKPSQPSRLDEVSALNEDLKKRTAKMEELKEKLGSTRQQAKDAAGKLKRLEEENKELKQTLTELRAAKAASPLPGASASKPPRTVPAPMSAHEDNVGPRGPFSLPSASANIPSVSKKRRRAGPEDLSLPTGPSSEQDASGVRPRSSHDLPASPVPRTSSPSHHYSLRKAKPKTIMSWVLVPPLRSNPVPDHPVRELPFNTPCSNAPAQPSSRPNKKRRLMECVEIVSARPRRRS